MIDQIRAMVLFLLERYGMDSACLFGSYARSEADAASDIDVILYGGEDFNVLGIFGVAELLHRASGKNADVYEISELNDGPFKDAVLRDAVAL